MVLCFFFAARLGNRGRSLRSLENPLPQVPLLGYSIIIDENLPR